MPNVEMTHLDKAKGALAHAAEISEREDLNDEANKGHHTDYIRLLDIAGIQASVATAEAGVAAAAALERIADRLEQLEWMKVGNVEKARTVLYRGRPIGHVDDPDHSFEAVDQAPLAFRHQTGTGSFRDGSTEYGSGVWEPTRVSR